MATDDPVARMLPNRSGAQGWLNDLRPLYRIVEISEQAIRQLHRQHTLQVNASIGLEIPTGCL